MQDLVRYSAIVVLLGTLAALVLGRVLAGRALAPLSRVTATAHRVARSGTLSERIALKGPEDELQELADTFDAMLERLDRSFDGQRRFVANASHELRTPLAVTQTVIEVALADPRAPTDLRAVAPTVLESVQRSELLIDGLLVLARGEHEPARRAPVDLAELLRWSATMVTDEAQAMPVSIHLSPAPAVAFGDPVLLERLVINIVQNAVRHNVAEGVVNAVTSREDDGVLLRVSNTGTAVAPHEVEALFEPFRRGTSRLAHPGCRGVGLGLSIVHAVTRAHGGSVEAHARPEGGLDVRVVLPTVP